ncbi:MAG TPA: helix-hairpin-helix domain-containing protein [Clostridia bacterium]
MEIIFFGRKIKVKYLIIAVSAVVVSVILCIIGFNIKHSSNSLIIEKKTSSDMDTKKEKTTSKSKSSSYQADNEITVYVVGCVKSPGLVNLKKGSLLNDAVNLAGGVTEEADVENINMAYKLEDNVMIRIKSKKQKSNEPVMDELPSGMEVIAGIDEGAREGNSSGAKININKATAQELDKLPGIGPSKANDIIAYREKNGRFKKAEDIVSVPGIKQSLFNSIKDKITVN